MSTAALLNDADLDFAASDRFERMPRRDARPMPVHSAASARRAASRDRASHCGGAGRCRKPSGFCRRHRRKLI